MGKKKKDKKNKQREMMEQFQAAARAARAKPSMAELMPKIGKARLTAALLELAGTKFAELGDNPLDLRQFLPHVEDRRALMQAFHDWNQTPEIFNPEGEYPTVSDASMMLWIADEMNKQIEAVLAGTV